jgi:LDH2 family malate/lactate/ureidoglycolate dehydrogenase
MTVDLSLAEAHDLAVRALTAAGATEANARPVAGP